MDIESIIEEAALPQRTVTVCVRGDLLARWDELHAQWRTAPESGGSLAVSSPKAALAQQMRDVQAEMEAASRTFVFEALPPEEYSALIEAHPPKKGTQGRFNPDTLRPVLVAECAVNPAMTVDQVNRLFKKLSTAQCAALGDAAYLVNEQAVDIPFEGGVYAETPNTGSE